VNVTTTRKLIEDGWLSPYRVFSCAEPNMAGVAIKSSGEWEEAGASKAALEVVGDVVAEYLKHGEGRKFICSGVDTAHVEEMQRQFLAASRKRRRPSPTSRQESTPRPTRTRTRRKTAPTRLSSSASPTVRFVA
jgi:hypothetical protein